MIDAYAFRLDQQSQSLREDLHPLLVFPLLVLTSMAISIAVRAGRRHRAGRHAAMWPESGMTAAKNVKLVTLIERGMREIVYTYDMGDDWRHTISVKTVGPGEPDVT